jgi:hypothetical protein
MTIARWVIWCAVLLVMPVVGVAQGLPEPLETAIARVAPSELARDFTRCKLQDALWGGYDVRVFITQGSDALPYRLELKQGQFSYGLDPEPQAGTPPHFERDGRLEFATPMEAFARGLPFFIQAATLVRPNQLAVTMLSNTSVLETDALLLAVIDDVADAAELSTQTALVASSSAPQTITLTHEGLDKARSTRLAVLRGADSRALVIGCLISNEVDVTGGPPQ